MERVLDLGLVIGSFGATKALGLNDKKIRYSSKVQILFKLSVASAG